MNRARMWCLLMWVTPIKVCAIWSVDIISLIPKPIPFGFNPFHIGPGESLDTEKKESIKTLLLALWKKDNENFNRSEYVALSNALTGYYERKIQAFFPALIVFTNS